jgi:glycine dehydrogenase subunit 2
LYYDGANLNAIMGKVRPGDMGFDIVHFNLHKTFSTPHGGGGPGGGPIGVKEHLAKHLPVPVIEKKDDGTYFLNYDLPDSIGKVKGFYGNYNVNAKAHAYIKLMGGNGLTKISEVATLNCNYMKERLLEKYDMPFKRLRKHEFVLSGSRQKARGFRTLDIAKRLMDYGFHASTVYFPLIVDEALMIEPTESEPKEELDAFCDALLKIADEDPELVKDTPKSTPVSRIDEVYAARTLILSYRHFLKETCSQD